MQRRENLYTLFVQVCVWKKMKIQTHFRKSGRTEIVGGSVSEIHFFKCYISNAQILINLDSIKIRLDQQEN